MLLCIKIENIGGGAQYIAWIRKKSQSWEDGCYFIVQQTDFLF